MAVKRLLLTIAYDGTEFHGYQIQPGVRTVEGELRRALAEVTGAEPELIGASRTDSGVHALGNAVVFDTAASIPAERYPFALLSHLPQDLRVVSGTEVPPDWHPRRQASRKTYVYRYCCGQIENPLTRRFAAFHKGWPELDRMREAARFLEGEHDFTSFANPASQILQEGGSPVRTIREISISGTDTAGCGACPAAGASQTVTIRITGSGFLYNMVRIIAGSLMQVGCGTREPFWIREALDARDRTKAGPTAEARGLTLAGIEFDCSRT